MDDEKRGSPVGVVVVIIATGLAAVLSLVKMIIGG